VNYLRIAIAGVVGAALGWLIAMVVAWLSGVWTLRGGLTPMALAFHGPLGAFAGLVLAVTILLYTRSRSESFLEIGDRVLTITGVIVVFIASAVFIVIHNLEVIASR
jgi:hypothetical protein